MAETAAPVVRTIALDGRRWTEAPPAAVERAAASLEAGAVLFLPALAFDIREDERALFAPAIAAAKNISFDPATGRVGGADPAALSRAGATAEQLQALLARFSDSAAALAGALLPAYGSRLVGARASFRPVEIAGRQTSWRHDDTRLHIDSFPATPVQGRRILRLFTNVNPEGRARTWRLGEPFDDVAARFLPRLRMPLPGSAALLEILRITKTRRSPYDALMLRLHDAMKADEAWQRGAPQQPVEFPAGSTWVAFTDQVSHAAMAGQYQLEQTFLLPVEAMREPGSSPLRTLERLTGRSLV
jgi:hypothetical protein